MLTFYRYVDPASKPYRRQLEDWFAALDPERDNGECSYGPRSSRARFYNANYGIDPFDPDCLLGTYFLVESPSDLIVGTGTLVDNRDFREKYKVPGQKRLELLLTHHDRRRSGYGSDMCAYLIGLTQLVVDRTEDDQMIDALCTTSEPAIKICWRLGFVPKDSVVIDDPESREPSATPLYVKHYAPTYL